MQQTTECIKHSGFPMWKCPMCEMESAPLPVSIEEQAKAFARQRLVFTGQFVGYNQEMYAAFIAGHNSKVEIVVLAEALKELVALKDYKDAQGKSAEYLLRQPKAWEAAREALQEYSSKEVKQEQEELPTVDLGTCQECKKVPASIDYNGHGYNVCKVCYKSLSNEFDEEYK